MPSKYPILCPVTETVISRYKTNMEMFQASALVASCSILCTEIRAAVKKKARIAYSGLYIYVPGFLEISIAISK